MSKKNIIFKFIERLNIINMFIKSIYNSYEHSECEVAKTLFSCAVHVFPIFYFTVYLILENTRQTGICELFRSMTSHFEL